MINVILGILMIGFIGSTIMFGIFGYGLGIEDYIILTPYLGITAIIFTIMWFVSIYLIDNELNPTTEQSRSNA